MPGNLPITLPESNREARLAVLTSLAWLLLLPLGWFLTYNPLARQTLFRIVLGVAYLAVALLAATLVSILPQARLDNTGVHDAVSVCARVCNNPVLVLAASTTPRR